MVKRNLSPKEITPDSIVPGLILLDVGKSDNQIPPAVDIAFRIAVDNRIPTVYFSLEKKEEMILKDLLTKLFGRYTDDVSTIASMPKEEFDNVKDGIICLSKAPLYIDDYTNISIDTIQTLAKVIVTEKKLSLFIIDGIHLLEEENPIRLLENMATDLGVTIIAL